MAISVTFDEDELVNLLVDRIKFWTSDEVAQNLYREMLR